MAATKTDIVEKIAEDAGISKVEAKAALESLVNQACAGADETGFTIPGLGKLVKVYRSARKGRNPQTGAEIDIPARWGLKFKVSKAAKDAAL
jgi:DNA-binding protein HU-beta